MSYKVISAAAVVKDASGSMHHFYRDAVISGGFNDARCDELVEEGFLEKVTVSDDDSGADKPAAVKDILAEVGDDKDKAQAALDAENASEKPRTSLVAKLEAVLAASA